MAGRRLVERVVDTFDLVAKLFLFLVVFLINPPVRPQKRRHGGGKAIS